jgi:hypothetical protein
VILPISDGAYEEFKRALPTTGCVEGLTQAL